MDTHSPEAFRRHIRVLIGIFACLLVLTVLTVWASHWPVAIPAAAVVIALAIAGVKGSLVAAFFMHLKGEKPAIFWLLVVTFVFLLAILLLPLMMLVQTIQGNAG